jgi:hypothetical protein
LASAPALIDTAKINNDFEKRLAVNSQYWTKFSNESENVANEIHSKNNWHGVTSRTARPEVLAAIGRAGSYKDSLIKYSAVIAADQRTEIARAQIENEVTKQTNNNWVSSFGEWFAVASLFFELSLFLIFFWRSNYETRELKEIEYLIQDEPQTHVRTIKDQIKDKLKNVVKTDVPASLVTNKIGFHKDENETKDENKDKPKEPADGVVIPKTGRQRTNRIWVSLDGGTRLKLCTPSMLRTYINGNDPDRAEEFKKYLFNLENWKK